MFKYLSSIGFKSLKNKKSYSKLVDLAILEPTEKYISNFGKDTIKMEVIKKVGNRINIMIRGEIDESEDNIIDLVIPYYISKYMIDTSEIDIEKLNDKEEYYVTCEETNTGIPITFYLQNVVDYLDVENKKNIYIEGINLSGFCEDGYILLPIEKDEIEELLDEEEEEFRMELLKAARDGDEEAIELLALEEEETNEIIEDRIKNEDLLSIIDGYFMPYGIKGDEYSILATIKEIEIVKNDVTGEEVYLLGIKCIGLKMEVCINKEQLVGEPAIGRRFKGIVWLQGIVNFSE
ncbi:uncharacterized protein DUF3881 [Natranaerovirga pectinivora]|uniref:Uncharacterized protein DUF3881 n=1 Tax=Natranaerovirga pectinivora TaxID=682400 RepID=A0A4R3MIG1_9FIRM|nr:DUF3881 family protein [Natranaerovirga pectinivora]TCT12264.1 uncharacterized protein DUF3881 [Natranaerovirga pectinivora]